MNDRLPVSKPVNLYCFTRPLTLNRWLDRVADFMGGEKPRIKALEIGRLRSATEVTGHSTLHIATHPAVEHLVSVDVQARTEKVCRALLPDTALAKIEFVNADGVRWLSEHPANGGSDFDFIYLDARDEAEQALELLLGCLLVSHRGTIIIMDDTDREGIHKGDLALPYVRKYPKLFHIIEQIPKDPTCHGQTVIGVKGEKDG